MPMYDAESQVLAGFDESLQAIQDLLQRPWRNIAVFTPFVEPRLFDAAAVIAALRARLLEQPRARGRLLLPPAAQWRRDCPRLVALLERLGALELRFPDPYQNTQRPEASHLFIVADETGVMRHVDPQRGHGYYAPGYRREARQLNGFFDDVWEKALRDDELRNLQL